MSMHAVEDFIELAVCVVADSGLPVQEKRNLIHTLFILEGYGDCSFTHCRTTRRMVESAYTFLFDNEEMWDYEQNRAYYDNREFDQEGADNGDIYTYEDYDDRFPEADGKICVDSGSPAWEQMVRCGRITGAGARPVEVLPFADAMRMARHLILHQYGGMDSYTKQGYYAAVLMSGIPGELSEDTPEELYVELLGVTKRQCEEGGWDAPDMSADARPEDGPLGRVYRFCGELVTIVPVVDADDGLITLYGYRSQRPVSTKAGNLLLRFDYRNGGMRSHVFQTGDDPGSCAWYVNRKETLAPMEAFVKELEAGVAPLRRMYAGWEEYRTRYEQIAQSGKVADSAEACRSLLAEIADLFERTEIPAELTEQEGPYTVLLLEFCSYAQAIAEFSRQKTVKERAPHFEEQAACFLQAVQSRQEKHRQAAAAKQPPLSMEEQKRIEALKNELTQIEAAAPSEAQHNARSVELLDALWRAALPLEERLYYFGQLYGFLKESERQVREQTDNILKHYEAVPDMTRPLAAAEAYVSGMPAGSGPVTLVLVRAENGVDYDINVERA